MAPKTKLELKLPVTGGEVVFECEWEPNVLPNIKRSGVAVFEVSLLNFASMITKVSAYLDSINRMRGV